MTLEQFLEVKTTFESKEEAERVAAAAVAARLCACAQVAGPIHSTYWWNGSVEQCAEWLCTMKTIAGKFDALAAFIRQEHSYDNPEIVATPIAQGSAEYLHWVSRETAGP
ncbi:MAG: divalent-cation tolerance protein CutA [Actinomycetota bacterium]